MSTDKQDAQKQEYLLLKHAQQHELHIDQFMSVEMYSRKSIRERHIDELMNDLTVGDVILVAELSRLGRKMFEVIEIINRLGQKELEVVFVRQPELSTVGPHRKLPLAIYSYFAEAEREFISLRTKQGLAAARAKGKQLGRPKGSRDKHRVLDPYRSTIKEHLQMRVPLRQIQDIVNPQLTNTLSYTANRYFVMQDPELLSLWKAYKKCRPGHKTRYADRKKKMAFKLD